MNEPSRTGKVGCFHVGVSTHTRGHAGEHARTLQGVRHVPEGRAEATAPAARPVPGRTAPAPSPAVVPPSARGRTAVHPPLPRRRRRHRPWGMTAAGQLHRRRRRCGHHLGGPSTRRTRAHRATLLRVPGTWVRWAAAAGSRRSASRTAWCPSGCASPWSPVYTRSSSNFSLVGSVKRSEQSGRPACFYYLGDSDIESLSLV